MITDDQGTQILKKMDEQSMKIDERFVKMDEKFMKIDERFVKIDEQFMKIDERFVKIDEQFVKMDERFEVIEKKLDHVIDLAVNNQHVIKNLVTRKEFEEKLKKREEEDVAFRHATIMRLEKLENRAAA